MDPTVLPAKQALWMATRGGAEALNLSDMIGSIEVGKRADIVVIDTRRIRYIPVRDPYTAITYCSSGSDVKDVIVDGKIIVRDGRLQTMDSQKIAEDLEDAVRELFER